jgi:tetratricopeptide (TPR) repeat protein
MKARQLTKWTWGVLFTLFFAAVPQAHGQTLNQEDDPIKLFERAQDAHAKNDYKTAIEFYDAAIRLKPEFPEAEFQRALALLSIDKKDDALTGFKRAVELRPDWAFAYAKFGSALAVAGTWDGDAEPILRTAIALDEKNLDARVRLAFLILRRDGRNKEALNLIRTASALKDATAETWQHRAYVEAVADDFSGALASITRAIELDPENPSMFLDRARIKLGLKDRVGALADLDNARNNLTLKSPNSQLGVIVGVVQLYARLGKPDESLRIMEALDERTRNQPVFVELRAGLAELAVDAGAANPEDLAALEKVLQIEPQNARLLARLGNAYRRTDPLKSQDYYYRALKIEPANSKFAIGYAAALIQGRRFAEAVPILREVIARTPDEYLAHANLALALYELKDFQAAIMEYEWIATARPELAATYFFLATAHDNLQQYPEALAAYEKFLARADATNNQLEIDKVHLRLPVLRAQIKKGQGKRKVG